MLYFWPSSYRRCPARSRGGDTVSRSGSTTTTVTSPSAADGEKSVEDTLRQNMGAK
ncbi:hypothetical protein KCP75_07535 [Salmonella enterica subsp. enterica]|nr:hypothetical protein KCP75_07535 [Salmonella enterica subsp. enterica]